jgi:hypothetical protein
MYFPWTSGLACGLPSSVRQTPLSSSGGRCYVKDVSVLALKMGSLLGRLQTLEGLVQESYGVSA